jgi:hypothetical protein
MHACMYIYVCVYVHVYAYVCAHVCLCVLMYAICLGIYFSIWGQYHNPKILNVSLHSSHNQNFYLSSGCWRRRAKRK